MKLIGAAFPNMVGLIESVPTNMKVPVTDAAVDEYTALLRAGGPLGKVFPAKVSECDFTPTQREKIRIARADKRAMQKKAKPTVGPPDTTPISKSPAQLERTMTKALTKLRRILYLQSGNCFFCGKPLAEKDASVEHLNPKSRGGTNSADNEVVCHKTLNEIFGNMELKRKFEFVLKKAGAFRCPGT